jgi:ribosomal-protein-alanine N-acetyltransferase
LERKIDSKAPSGENLNIRVMQENDLSTVSQMERSEFLAPWSEDSFRSAIRDPKGMNLVCETDGRLIGYLTSFLVLDEAFLTNLFIEPRERRKGYGRRLLNNLIGRIREKGVKRILLEVRRGNFAAVTLYQKMGFSSIGVRPGYYSNPKEDALVMRLSLLDG